MNVIDKVVPMKERRANRNSQEWFNGEIANELKMKCDILLKNFLKSNV